MNAAANGFGWRVERSEGIWRHGPVWAKPLTAAAPWINLTLLLAMLSFMGARFPEAAGTLVDLPAAAGAQAVRTELAVMILPGGADGGTLAFFDDARYSLDDESSMAAFGATLAGRIRTAETDTLLLLADRRVPSGDVMRVVGMMRDAGAARVQIAERRGE